MAAPVRRVALPGEFRDEVENFQLRDDKFINVVGPGQGF